MKQSWLERSLHLRGAKNPNFLSEISKFKILNKLEYEKLLGYL